MTFLNIYFRIAAFAIPVVASRIPGKTGTVVLGHWFSADLDPIAVNSSEVDDLPPKVRAFDSEFDTFAVQERNPIDHAASAALMKK
jgi:hypothetical protein